MPKTKIELPDTIEHLSILDSDGNLDSALGPRSPPRSSRACTARCCSAAASTSGCCGCSARGASAPSRRSRARRRAQVGSVGTLRAAPTGWCRPSARPRPCSGAAGRSRRSCSSSRATSRAAQPAPDQRDLPICIPVATQLPHAVGLAYAAQYRGDDAVVMVYFGDGATSEGDFHEAMNFAGVWHVPVVFVCPEQPVGDLGAAQEADPLAHHRPEGARLRLPGHPGGRQRRARGLRGEPRGGGAGAPRRRPDADRVRHVPPGRAHHRRRSDEVPLGRGGQGVGAEGPADPLRRLPARSGTSWSTGLEEQIERGDRAGGPAFEAVGRRGPLGMFDHAYATRRAPPERSGPRCRPERARSWRRGA